MKRRTFLRNTALAGAALTLPDTASLALSNSAPANKLPRWRGFNLLDFFSPNPASSRGTTTEEHIKWMSDWGFDFIRMPMAYPSYLDIDHTRKITPEEVYKIKDSAVEKVDRVVSLGHKYNMHVSLNLHRAPGYCINAGFHEPYNLWKDQEALDAFCFHWDMWAKRYKNVSSKLISFDLVNEPTMRDDMNDQRSKRTAVPGDVYRKVAKAALEAIRRHNPDHLVIADGNNGGNTVIPELKDLGIGQSCRGYHPAIISHYKAPWAFKDPDNLPEPKWPGQVGNQYLSREMLEKAYAPWIELVHDGVGVHCGACGWRNKSPHDVCLAWFADVLDILKQNNIGFALWEFIGTFGILDSGRADVHYQDWHGHKLDAKLLKLMQDS